MRYSWANTALLALIVIVAVTGFYGLVSGSSNRAICNDIHLAGAFGILGILGWKTALAVRSLRFPRCGTPGGILPASESGTGATEERRSG